MNKLISLGNVARETKQPVTNGIRFDELFAVCNVKSGPSY